MDDLSAMLDVCFWETSDADKKLIPKLSSAGSFCKAADGALLLIAAGSEIVELDENDAGTRGRVASSRTVATEVECLLCGRTFATAFMRQHIGAHLLEADWGAYGKARPQFPCGLCGVHKSMQWYLDPCICFEYIFHLIFFNSF